MGATVQVNEKTSFVLKSGKLVAVEEANRIEKELANQRKFFPRHLSEDEQWKLIPEFVRENDLPMFLSVSEYTLRQVQEWLKIKAENQSDYQKKYVISDLGKAIDTSSLLDRLLKGKGAFKDAPPESYGHPWYDLVDYGEDVCIDAFFSTKYSGGQQQEILRIDGEAWDIEEKIEDEVVIVRYPEDKTETLYLFTRMTEDDYIRLMHPRMRKLADGKDKYSWKLTRLEQVDDVSDAY